MASSKKSFYNACYISAVIFLMVFVFVAMQQLHEYAGWALMLFFVSLAIAFRGNQLLRGLSFTVTIIGLVSLAMYYPQYFITVGNVKLSSIVIPLLQIIMFGMGTELSLKDFANVIRMPKGIIVGVLCHYIVMPLVGFGIANIFNFP